jgi:hypothetical protein
MRKLISLLGVLFCLFVQSSSGQAGNNLSVSYSPKNITKAMDFELRSNSMSYLLYVRTQFGLILHMKNIQDQIL